MTTPTPCSTATGPATTSMLDESLAISAELASTLLLGVSRVR